MKKADSAALCVCRATLWSERWVTIFEENSQNKLRIPWEQKPSIGADELALIRESLRIFQLGESSSGNRLIQLAREFATKQGDPSFVCAIRLFIAEEQNHAALLARFLQSEGIALLSAQWTDTIFRFLRKTWNFSTCISVLLTAELVAKIYYHALFHCTSSPVLRTICAQLLRDEIQHIRFHTEILACLKTKSKLPDYVFRCFYFGTMVVVWTGHRQVLKAGGYSLGTYLRRAKQNLLLAFAHRDSFYSSS